MPVGFRLCLSYKHRRAVALLKFRAKLAEE